MASPGWMASSVTDLVRWGCGTELADLAGELGNAGRNDLVGAVQGVPISIALTDDGVCAMLIDCQPSYEYVGFDQPSVSGTYAGLFYD